MTKQHSDSYGIKMFAEDLEICSCIITQKCEEEPLFSVSKETKKSAKIILTGLKAQIGVHVPYEANKPDIE